MLVRGTLSLRPSYASNGQPNATFRNCLATRSKYPGQQHVKRVTGATVTSRELELAVDESPVPAAGTYVVKPHTGGLLAAKPRLEIHDFIKEPLQLTLFLRAFRNYQDRPSNDPRSYFQHASIHGLPYRAFDKVDPLGEAWPTTLNPGDFDKDGDAKRYGGYCQHGTQLFPAWHRPYVLMVEQEICQEAIRLAEGYADPAYKQAAQELRLPYFDWGLRKDLPPILYQETVAVTDEDGSTQNIRNPLASFTIPEDINLRVRNPDQSITVMKADDPTRQPTTLRHAQKQQDGTWVSDPVSLQQTLTQNLDGLRQRLMFMLRAPSDRSWICFSNHFAKDREPCLGQESLEVVHDLMHNILAGPYDPNSNSTARAGHMSEPDYAAFDPIFWLHHCNVDRLLAMWEALHPTECIDPKYLEKDESGTFSNDPGKLQPSPSSNGTGGTSDNGTDSGTVSSNNGASLSSTPTPTTDGAGNGVPANVAFTPLAGGEYWCKTSPQYPFRSKASPEEFWDPERLLVLYRPAEKGQTTKWLGYYYPDLATPADTEENKLIDRITALYHDAPGQPVGPSTNLRFFNLSRQLANESYLVRVYLRTPDEKEFELDDKHYAGAMGVFRRSAYTLCRNCNSRPAAAVLGDVPLGAAMQRLGLTKEQLQERSAAADLIKLVLVTSSPAPKASTVPTGDLAITTKPAITPTSYFPWSDSFSSWALERTRSLLPYGVRKTLSNNVDVRFLTQDAPVAVVRLSAKDAEHL